MLIGLQFPVTILLPLGVQLANLFSAFVEIVLPAHCQGRKPETESAGSSPLLAPPTASSANTGLCQLAAPMTGPSRSKSTRIDVAFCFVSLTSVFMAALLIDWNSKRI